MTITRINPQEWNNPIAVIETSVKRDVAVSSHIWATAVSIRDMDGMEIGYLRGPFLSDGYEGVQLETLRNVNGSNVYNGLRMDIDASGTPRVSVSHPAAWRSAIDAAASSHSHTGMMTYTNYGQTKKNLNDLNANGFYSCFNPTNAPVANSWVNVMVTRFDNNSGYATQIAWTSTPAVYYRTCSGGSWGAWKRFTLS